MKTKEAALLILLFFVCLDLCLLRNITDLDVWARMAVGKLVLELGHVNYQDIFAYTPTKSLWVDHEWGSGVVFFAIADALGQRGLLLLRALLYFGAIFWVHLCVRERIENPNSLILHGLLAYAVLFGFYVTIRSQAFTYFFFALWLYLLERSRRGRNKGLLYIPATMILWANLHAGFVSGLGLISMYGVGNLLNRGPWRKYLLLFMVCCLVTLFNPYGLEYWHYVFQAVTMPRPDIIEWQAFSFQRPVRLWIGFGVLFSLSFSLLLVDRFKKIRVDWVDVLLLFITGALAIRHFRHTPFFCIACFPFVYSSLRRGSNLETGEERTFLRVFSLPLPHLVRNLGQGSLHGLLLAIAILLACSLPPCVKMPPSLLPTKAIEFIKENRLKGNLLVPFSWGSYAIWSLFPQCRVSMDGRYEEVYPDTTYDDIYRFTEGKEGWKRTLEKYEHDLILVRRNSRIVLRMKDVKDWGMVYEDEICNLYVPAGMQEREWSFPEQLERDRDPFSTDGHGKYVADERP